MTTDDLGQKSRAILALARGATTDTAGTEAGVSGRTVRRWREDPAFEAEVDAARRALLDRAVAGLSAGAGEAVDVLRAALADPTAAVRVRAAVALLSALPSVVEHVELTARIADLETRLNEGTDL